MVTLHQIFGIFETIDFTLIKTIVKWSTYNVCAPIVLMVLFVFCVDSYFVNVVIEKDKIFSLLFTSGIFTVVVSLYEDYKDYRDAYPLYMIVTTFFSAILIGFNFCKSATEIPKEMITNRIDEEFIVTTLAILAISLFFKFRILKRKNKI